MHMVGDHDVRKLDAQTWLHTQVISVSVMEVVHDAVSLDVRQVLPGWEKTAFVTVVGIGVTNLAVPSAL